MHDIDMNIEQWVEPDVKGGNKNYLAEEQNSEAASLPSPDGVSLLRTIGEEYASQYSAFQRGMIERFSK
jgi:hypothetical protein